jgi:hypothetical protein
MERIVPKKELTLWFITRSTFVAIRLGSRAATGLAGAAA